MTTSVDSCQSWSSDCITCWSSKSQDLTVDKARVTKICHMTMSADRRSMSCDHMCALVHTHQVTAMWSVQSVTSYLRCVTDVFGALTNQSYGFHADVWEGTVTRKFRQTHNAVLEGIDGQRKIHFKYLIYSMREHIQREWEYLHLHVIILMCVNCIFWYMYTYVYVYICICMYTYV